MPRKPKKQPSAPSCPYVKMMGPAIFTLAHWHIVHSTGKDASALIAAEKDHPDIFVVSGAAKEKFRELYAQEFNRDAAKELERIIFGKEQP